ncbi:MAG: hypothetical protein H6Q84_2222 [Deltaproteobacteria bacterium]|nr:hypothetical protein [Deltaproteobacteria bacterium]
MNRRVLLLLLLPALVPPGAHADEGYRLYEGMAASVNKEVLFLSDVLREQCFHRCATMPGSGEEALSLREARDRLISDTLALQEQKKLALGQVDNAVLADQAREAVRRTEGCPSSCREGISPREVSVWVERKLLIRDFLRRRIGAFIEIDIDDARKEYQHRLSQGEAAPGLTVEKVRQELLEEKIGREVRNWYDRAASKSSIALSPLEER